MLQIEDVQEVGILQSCPGTYEIWLQKIVENLTIDSTLAELWKGTSIGTNELLSPLLWFSYLIIYRVLC